MLFVPLLALASLGLFRGGEAACSTATITKVSGSHAPVGEVCAGDLIFEDNFDEFDLRKWQHEVTLGGGGNWEFEWYSNNRTNSFVQDGNLHIKPTLVADDTGEDYLYSGTLDIYGGSPYEGCTNPQWWGCFRTGTAENALNSVKSARIRTLNSFSFKYGVIEVRAKLPAGDWLWPAIWMLPTYAQYAGWPASGEIDILESRGNKQLFSAGGVNIGTQQVGSTLHWGPDYNNNRYSYTHFEKNNEAGYDADFHTYKLEWTEEKLTFYIDDEELGTVAPPEGGFWELGELDKLNVDNPWRASSNQRLAPFDQEFYIIINLAVGGTSYFPDDASNPGGKPWLNSSPHASTDFWQGHEQWYPTWNKDTDDSHLQVDYVKVWAL